MALPGVDTKDRSMILAHYYRALVGRADIWRMRMDTTTNWAIGATGAVVSFALGNATVPHYVLFIAPLMTASFLMLEARRLTFYHLWQQRVLLLEKGLIEPALTGSDTPPPEGGGLETLLGEHLGRTAPNMPVRKAVARRLRRIYIYLFGVQWLAWGLKVATQPEAARSMAEWMERAQIGVVPGEVTLGISTLLYALAIYTAVALGGVDSKRTP